MHLQFGLRVHLDALRQLVIPVAEFWFLSMEHGICYGRARSDARGD